MKKTLVILDAHALIHRSYHALPSFLSPSGEPMGAVYGVASVLLKIIRELKPTHIAAAFDMAEPTFRHIVYEKYKATRPETESELVPQFEKVRELFTAFGVPIFEAPGFEADDIIGTFAELYKNEKDLVIIIASGDMDTLQLVRDQKVMVYTLRKGIEDTVIYDEKKVEERFGFSPVFLADFKGLKGDPSDNIIGVRGIGEKTATMLIQEFGTIENLYAKLKKGVKSPAWLKERLLKILLENEEEALFSKELAKIRLDAPVRARPEDLDFQEIPYESASRVLRKFHFPSLIDRLEAKEAAKKLPEAIELAKAAWNEFEKKLSPSSKLALFVEGEKLYVGAQNNIFSISREASRDLKESLEKFFAGKHIVAHNAKEAFHFLGFVFPVEFDVALASWLVNPERRSFHIEDLAHELARSTGSPMLELEELESKLRQRLKADELENIYYNFELPLIPVLFGMERSGVRVEAGGLKELESHLEEELKKLEAEIWKLAGGQFDIASPKQLSRILFEKLSLSPKGLKKTTTRSVSTQFSELVKLRGLHPIIEHLIKFREQSKLLNTYVAVLPGLIGSDGRIHTTFNQKGTATGRLSSSEPNLQNIPIRSSLGQKIRRAFVADEGYVLASFDYSQLELRIAAAFASDAKLMEAFRKGEDVHLRTASEIFKAPASQVTSQMRRRAKTINFGILYGMGAKALAASLGVELEESEGYLRQYLKDFPGIAAYRERVVAEARQRGYVKTLFGRRRYFPQLTSRFQYVRAEAERMAINAPIQGTEADIIKRAMIKVAAMLKKEGKFNGARLLLQVHDELLFELGERDSEAVMRNIKGIMESVPELEIPIVVDFKVGPNWQDMEPRMV